MGDKSPKNTAKTKKQKSEEEGRIGAKVTTEAVALPDRPLLCICARNDMSARTDAR